MADETSEREEPSRLARWRRWRSSLVVLFQRRVVDPYSRFYFGWLGVIALAVLYNYLVVVFRSAFRDIQSDHWSKWLVMDCLADVIYVADVIVRSKTAFFADGILVVDPPLLRRHYVSSTPCFPLDVLSLLPTDLLLLVPPSTPNRPYVRLNRLLRVQRLVEFVDRMETQSRHPTAVRTACLVALTASLVHWNACLYIYISDCVGVSKDSWVYQGQDRGRGLSDHGAGSPYVYSLFWSTLMLLSIGNLPAPVTNFEIAFVTVDFLVGLLLSATIIGSLSGLIASANVGRTEFEQKVDAVKSFMKIRGVGVDLQTKVSEWFDYMWTNRRSMDEDSVLEVLPETLRAEIATEVHMDALRRVSIFETCEKDLLAKLVTRLKSVVFSPGDFVCKKGDVGTELYIVRAGLLSVVAEDGRTVYATIGDGGFFGEVSLLGIAAGGSNRRVADVVSIGFSDIFVLSKDDLWRTLDEYPEAREKLVAAGKARLRQGNMYQEEERKEEGEEKGGKAQLDSIVAKVGALEEKVRATKEAVIRSVVEVGVGQWKLRKSVSRLEEGTKESERKEPDMKRKEAKQKNKEKK